MKQFIGTEIVQAEPAYRVKGPGICDVIPASECLDETQVDYAETVELEGVTAEEGYKVIYKDGYESWSPKDAFEKAYRRTDGMSFGLALEAVKLGHKIARAGWNGRGMFLYHVPAAAYPPSTDVAKKTFGGENVPYGAYIAMKTAQGNVVPWLASQTDMLTDDWMIVQ